MSNHERKKQESKSTSGGKGGDGKSSEPVKVLVRCRPLNEFKEEELCRDLKLLDSHTIEVKGSNSIIKTYQYDCVADDSKDQKYIFEQVGRPIVESSLQGINGTLFSYGQTGSGKTYTMSGTTQDLVAPSSPSLGAYHAISCSSKGIIQMVCEYLFNASKEDEERLFIEASYLEIYNETLIDLLADKSNQRNNHPQNNLKKLLIREDPSGSILVLGQQRVKVKCPEDCYELLRIGAERRKVGTTQMNVQSSRSHTVFTLNITKKNDFSGIVKTSRLYLVDLGGSERNSRTGTTGIRLREAGGINKSLSALGNVINSITNLNDPNNRIPSCRESKLTFLLKDALGGNSKLAVIATISPCLKSIDETISTLDFAQRCSKVINLPVINEILSSDIKQLHDQIKTLQISLTTIKHQQEQLSSSSTSSIASFSTSSSSSSSPSKNPVRRIECGTHAELRDVIFKKNKEIDDLKQEIQRLLKVNQELSQIIRDKEEQEISQKFEQLEHQPRQHDILRTPRTLQQNNVDLDVNFAVVQSTRQQEDDESLLQEMRESNNVPNLLSAAFEGSPITNCSSPSNQSVSSDPLVNSTPCISPENGHYTAFEGEDKATLPENETGQEIKSNNSDSKRTNAESKVNKQIIWKGISTQPIATPTSIKKIQQSKTSTSNASAPHSPSAENEKPPLLKVTRSSGKSFKTDESWISNQRE